MNEQEELPFLKKYGWIYDATKDFKDGRLSHYDLCQLILNRFQTTEELASTREQTLLKEVEGLKEEIKQVRKFERDANRGAEINAKVSNKFCEDKIRLEKELAESKKASADFIESKMMAIYDLNKALEESKKEIETYKETFNLQADLAMTLNAQLAEAKKVIERLNDAQLNTMSSDFVAIGKLEKELKELRSELTESKKREQEMIWALEEINDWADGCYCLTEEESGQTGGKMCPNCVIKNVLSKLNKPSERQDGK